MLREDGHVQYEGRNKNVIRSSGENVAASEIERVIMLMPAIKEVAVIGKRDENE